MTSTSLPRSMPRPPRGGPVRTSRRSKWRAIVLIAVHVAIAAHIAHWVITGSTLTPVEPSEAMQTLELGKINAGFVFFAVAILATLILGRWFCGWACHVVAYQDLSAWLLGKFGLRPKPIRSRLLMWTPLLLALYMFVWPQLRRLVHEEGYFAPPWRGSFMTENFWETFAGPGMAIVTLVVCGFLVVYWLGAKGFCTYGCPYGGFFAVVDKVAPGRIRVTDECEGCRHCTATCTSNVLVHEEVLKHGMVVDPGCMKCLDCVDVCPKGALYFGFGKPAIGLKKLAQKYESGLRTLMTFAVVFAIAWAWLHLSDDVREVPMWFEVATAGVIALVIALTGRGKGRTFDFSIGEEIAMAIVFLLASQWAYRRLYNAVPNLLAIGLGAVTALGVIAAWRLFRQRDVAVQNHELKKDGKLTRTGLWFAGIFALWMAFTVHSFVVQGQIRAMTAETFELRQLRDSTTQPTAAQQRRFREGLERARAHALNAHEWGLFDNAFVLHQLGKIEMLLGRGSNWDSVLGNLRAAVELAPEMQDAWIDLADALGKSGRTDEMLATLEHYHEEHPEDPRGWLRLAEALGNTGDTNRMIATLEGYIEHFPDDPDGWFRLATAHAQLGNRDETIRALEQLVTRFPEARAGWLALVDAHAVGDDRAATVATLRRMLEALPGDAEALRRLEALGETPK